MDRRKFVRSASVLLAATGLGCGADTPVSVTPPGTIDLTITGLDASATSGGSAVATPVGGGTAVPISIPAAGHQTAPAPPGNYSVQYTPPPNHNLAAGQTNPRTITVTSNTSTPVTIALVYVPPGTSGTITITVTGLTGAATTGGSAVAQRTDASGSPITINISTGGTGSNSSVPAGTYTITYTPPSGFNVSGGVTNPVTGKVVTVGGTATATFAVQPSGAPAPLFFSDWSTALGNSDAALRDTGKALPWDDIEFKGPTDFSVISAAGLGFPAGMAHVLRHEFLTPAYAAFCHINQKWPAPAVGESLYFRVYLRVAYPNTDADRDGNAHHPIQNTAAPNLYNWHWGNNADGTFNIQMWWDGDNSHWGPNTVPGSTGTKLNKNATYRIEWALTQVALGLFKMQIRIYDTDDVTLLYPDTDGNTKMVNFSGVTLLNYGAVLPGTASILQQVELGNNGWQGFSSTSYDYFGGFMVRKDNWCGPY